MGASFRVLQKQEEAYRVDPTDFNEVFDVFELHGSVNVTRRSALRLG